MKLDKLNDHQLGTLALAVFWGFNIVCEKLRKQTNACGDLWRKRLLRLANFAKQKKEFEQPCIQQLRILFVVLNSLQQLCCYILTEAGSFVDGFKNFDGGLQGKFAPIAEFCSFDEYVSCFKFEAMLKIFKELKQKRRSNVKNRTQCLVSSVCCLASSNLLLISLHRQYF
jgi:hypothetical protein